MIPRILAALRALLGDGRLDDLCALIDATAEPTPIYTHLPGEWDEAAELLADLDAVETVADFLYVCGEDA